MRPGVAVQVASAVEHHDTRKANGNAQPLQFTGGDAEKRLKHKVNSGTVATITAAMPEGTC